jgi:hypothetical protein
MQLPPFVPPAGNTEHLSIDELMKLAEQEEEAGFRESVLLQPASDNVASLGPGDCDPYHWARMAYWTSDEVAALSLGKNPTVVNFESCQAGVHRYQVCRDFLERRAVVFRAIETEQMFERTYPSHAVAWLERFKIDHPPALREAVEHLGLQIADWKTLYDSVVERAVELEEALEEADLQIQTQQDRDAQHANLQAWSEQALSALNGQADLIESREAENADLKFQVGELKNTIKELKGSGLGTRERDSLLKLVLGMAIEQYGFSPNETKSSATAAIVEDLIANGLELSDDTVRKYLKEATEKHWNREAE